MKARYFPAIIRVRGGLGLVALSLLAGCANSPRWGAWSKRPTDAQITAALQQPIPRVQYQAYAAQQR